MADTKATETSAKPAQHQQQEKKATYYVWTPIAQGVDEDGVRLPPIEPGTVATPASLDCSDEQFADYVEAGVVRPYPYPDMPDTWQDSPVNYLRAQLKEKSENEELLAVAGITGSNYSDTTEEEVLTAGASE